MAHTQPPLPQITYTETTEIPRASCLNDFLERVKQGNPVAYKIPPPEQFPAFSKWNEGYFSHSQVPVEAHDCTTERVFDVANSTILELARSAMKHKITLGEFVQNMKRHRQSQKTGDYSPIGSQVLSGTELYLRHNFVNRPSFQDILPDLQDYHRFLPVDDPSDTVRTLGFWISGGRMSTQLHFDNEGEDNMNFQIRGRKLMTLYAPKDGIHNLYPLPGRGASLSLVDPYHPNFQKFPRLAHTKPRVIELQAGEVLFIPARWWHDVRHLDAWNINVTCWYSRQRGQPVRDKNEGPWFVVTWADTLVAWSYIGKILVVKLVVLVMRLYVSVRKWLMMGMPANNNDKMAKKA